MSIISISADYLSIAGFVLTIVLIFATKSIKSKMTCLIKFKQFKTNKKSLLNELTSLQDLIIKDGIKDLKNNYDISKALRKLDNYRDFMTKNDKYALKRIKKVLQKGINDKNINDLTFNMGIIIGFLELRQDYDLNNL